MSNSPNKTILVAVASVVTLGTLALILFKVSGKQKYSYKRISKFISNPAKLSSPDQKDSWEKVSPKLLRTLEKISKSLGTKLTITSGFRSKSYNTKVGGASRSAHMTGEAVDISMPNYTKAIEIGRVAKKHGIKRIGVSNTFIHVDVSESLPQTRWAYAGTGISKSKINNDLGFA